MKVCMISVLGTSTDNVALFFKVFTSNCRLLCIRNRNLVTLIFINYLDCGLVGKEFFPRSLQICTVHCACDRWPYAQEFMPYCYGRKWVVLSLGLLCYSYLLTVVIYIYIYITAIGLTPGGNFTAHIYTQTVHRIQRTTSEV
jgi:hypothetical protein